MAKTDLFRRTLEAGTSFLDMSRERAETVVKEWVDAGDLGKGKAQKAIDDVLERSRKATDDLRDVVRREIATQLSAMGVATHDDIARLEAKLDAATAASSVAAAATAKAATKKPVRSPSATKKAARPKKAVAGSPATDAPPGDGGVSPPVAEA